MSMLSRAGDILAAAVTDLLDKAEDPAKMIRMIVVEMEEALADARASSARAVTDRRTLGLRMAELKRAQEGWTKRAELALAGDRNDLARAALIERQRTSDNADRLTHELAMLDEDLAITEAEVSRLEGKLRDARIRQTAIRSRMNADGERARLRKMIAAPTTEAVFARFELLQRRADQAAGSADAMTLAALPPTLDEAFAELRAQGRVEAEFASLKSRRAVRPDRQEM